MTGSCAIWLDWDAVILGVGMLIKSLAGLIAAAALLAGCAAPCGAPGGLCAPVVANTSTRPAAPAPLAFPREPVHPVLRKPVHTARIALILPLQSPTLAEPAKAVRDGFMAAWERDREGVDVELVVTGDAPQDTLSAYTRAVDDHDLVVGPLGRPAVDTVARDAAVTRPTLALNHPEHASLPDRMLMIGLSSADEARQVADWAARDYPTGEALILPGPAAWEQRLAKAFEERWSELGRHSQRVPVRIADGKLDQTALDQLATRVEVDRPQLLFAALDADELRQLRARLGNGVPCYGTSSVNPGYAPGAPVPELNGVRLLDLPWEVLPDDPSVMVYPRPLPGGQTLDMDRLYGLGIDAFRIARELALHPEAPFHLDGVTGLLAISLAPGEPSFARQEAAVIYRDGVFQPATGQR
jgi:hypothetical protein